MYTNIFIVRRGLVFRNFRIFPFLEKAMFSLFSSRKDALFSLLRKDMEIWYFQIMEISENCQKYYLFVCFTYLHHAKRFVQWPIYMGKINFCWQKTQSMVIEFEIFIFNSIESFFLCAKRSLIFNFLEHLKIHCRLYFSKGIRSAALQLWVG